MKFGDLVWDTHDARSVGIVISEAFKMNKTSSYFDVRWFNHRNVDWIGTKCLMPEDRVRLVPETLDNPLT